MRDVSLSFLVQKGESSQKILLAMKKRGFGSGKWNGTGGKFDAKAGDKNIADTAIRETEEEIGVRTQNLEKVAVLNFYFPYKEDWSQTVHVFFAEAWQGEPRETEEMAPKWFETNNLPYGEMWADDKFWLPNVLEGKKVKADFTFKAGEIIDKQDIKLVESLEN